MSSLLVLGAQELPPPTPAVSRAPVGMASYLISVTTLWITEGGTGGHPWLPDEAGATEGLGKPGRNLTFSPSFFLLPHTACQGLPGPAGPVSVLVLFALAFLTCVVFLVVYKVYKYDRACPDGFVLKNTQCIPEGLESYYAEQDSSAREKFYTVINHYNLAKQSITRSVSPWMSVLSEEKLSEQETEAAEKSA
ncbi:neuronal vesicle trafficking-associated protein 1 isoform X1 [Papio anubis]|uniref:neuronal vesicle trafficking-associated protein 1 isoform X1 n=1 Tax=Papio anubis TaxID=9555 RepID=UPI0004F23388|nr:neuronal vesicle trafficking-associated protein 1 isoform X1 [Papio anubis]